MIGRIAKTEDVGRIDQVEGTSSRKGWTSFPSNGRWYEVSTFPLQRKITHTYLSLLKWLYQRQAECQCQESGYH